MRALGGLMLATTFTLGACQPDDQRTDTLDPSGAVRTEMPAAAVAQLDSGNAAYRGAAYEPALRHYVRVTELAPDQAVGWFGLYMAHHALGNLAQADSALARARDAAPGASLIRDTTDGGRE